MFAYICIVFHQTILESNIYNFHIITMELPGQVPAERETKQELSSSLYLMGERTCPTATNYVGLNCKQYCMQTTLDNDYHSSGIHLNKILCPKAWERLQSMRSEHSLFEQMEYGKHFEYKNTIIPIGYEAELMVKVRDRIVGTIIFSIHEDVKAFMGSHPRYKAVFRLSKCRNI